MLVTDSVFKNTHGTRPSAGIDLEPDNESQRITNIRIQNSKFLDNAGLAIEIAVKKGTVAKVELTRNVFRGNLPILVENAPAVLASAILAIGKSRLRQRVRTQWMSSYTKMTARMVRICASK